MVLASVIHQVVKQTVDHLRKENVSRNTIKKTWASSRIMTFLFFFLFYNNQFVALDRLSRNYQSLLNPIEAQFLAHTLTSEFSVGELTRLLQKHQQEIHQIGKRIFCIKKINLSLT